MNCELSETDRLGDEIAEVAGHLNAATHQLLALIRRFDERRGWAEQGALSCARWLSWRIGLDPGAAREKVRVASALGTLPAIDGALRRGEVSYSQVRAMTRVATPENEVELLGIARASTAGQLEKLCRRFRALRQNGGAAAAPERYVRTLDTEDGMVRLDAKLRPEEAAVVWKAIEAARAVLRGEAPTGVSAETPSSRADALVAVAESFLACGPKAHVAAPIEVVVHTQKGVADAALDDGTPLPVETARRLSCDCAIVEVTEASDGTPLDVGRRTRSIPTAIRRALELRDGGCRFPGCTNRIYVDGHHIQHWADGGHTRLSNLCLLCRPHHTLVHEGGFAVSPREDGSLEFHRPDGREIAAVPPMRGVGGDPVAALAARLRDAGIAITAETTLSYWDGEPMDEETALAALL